ncbi:CHAT domain-containing protein [Lentzea sp. NPDC058450]|uniref:CHAT domain-containing protein n=1 Tax=Lentzea sp. NPDC058450 TaxID=3346505 RepID=UPI00364CFDF3
MIVTFTAQRPDDTARTVAELLARWGLKVLYVDWNPDEALGFPQSLLAAPEEPLAAVVRVPLLGPYVLDAVASVGFDHVRGDWAAVYADGLGDLLEACAERWRAEYEIVVIRDAAAGHPSRGIAVAHLPDAVVVDCRGIGAASLVSASEARHLLPYGRAELLVLPMHGPAGDFDRWTLTWVHATVRPERVSELAQDDVRALAALLGNGFAGTELLVADPGGYVAAAEHRDGVLEAARAVRPELPYLLPADDLDQVLRDLLSAEPAPVARLREVLMSDDELALWVSSLMDDPEYRPVDAQPTRSVSAPTRHVCPADGNYVWYRHDEELVSRCPDHDVVLEPVPIVRRVDPLQLWLAVAGRVRDWTVTGDPGTRSPGELEREALTLLAALPAVDASGPAGTVALSELQRAELLTGDARTEAQQRGLSLFALLREDDTGVPEPLLHDVNGLLESDREAVLHVAGNLWRAAGDREAPGLVLWAAALVAGPGLDPELLQNRVNTLLGLDAGTGDHTHLAEAVFLGRTALGNLNRPLDTAGSALAGTTAFGLVRWHALTGNSDVLDEAITLLRAETTNDQAWSEVPAILVSALSRRASATGSVPDVEEALAVGRSARALPDADGTLAASLSTAHLEAFELTGRLDDLDDAVVLARLAVDGSPPNRRARQSTLAGALHTRYRATRQLRDLTAAIALYRDAVADVPPNLRLETRANLADALLDLHHRNGDRSALREAADIAGAVVALTPEASPVYAGRLATVAATYELIGDTAEAVTTYRRVAERSRWEDPGTPERVFPLIQLLRESGAEVHLAEARTWADLLVAATPEDAPTHARALILLGDVLRAQGLPATDAYRSAAEAVDAATGTRVIAATRWALAAQAEHGRSDAVRAWATAVDALLQLASIGVDVETREHLLAEWLTVPRDAAACAIECGHPATALEFLEAGRTVLWNQAIDLRGDHSALAAVAPDTAARLTELAGVLAHPGDRDSGTVIRLAREWEGLVAEARTYPGFEGFLQRPRADRLAKALGERTVVVLNASRSRCDALVVTGAGVQVIPLPVSPDDVVAATVTMQAPMHRALPVVLPWLWEKVARPVLDVLALPPGSPLWWCPTGSFTLLPVHAAEAGDDGVHRRVVSSYTSTVTALVRAIGLPERTGGRATFVGVDHPPGSELAVLTAVAQEAAVVERSVGLPLDELQGPQATREAVRAAATGAAVLHLACHAQPSPANPREAGLELWDGRLTVRDLAADLTTPPDLVYLSACHTAAAGLTLPDEAISIAAAFLAAGSRNVVGTLWAVGDRDAATVARFFYEALKRTGDPARALHEAMTALRAQFPKRPAAWAPFVHMGGGEVHDSDT